MIIEGDIVIMEVMYKVCCGLDVHKEKLVACLKLKGKKTVIKEFGAETKDIKELANWLLENKCEKVAMESTASYWKPLWNIFEIKEISAMVINAKDYKNVPGKKTDVADSEWIADLLQHGLLKESFIPTREQRELREAVRYRKSLTQERARELNRMQKMLEGANIKITSVLTDVKGKTSRNLIDYVLGNDDDITLEKAEQLIANKKVKNKLDRIVTSMEGIITSFQKELLREVVSHIDDMTERINKMNEIIERYMTEYEKNLEKLEKIPGIGRKSAQIILVEIGQDMKKFPSENHISSWTGLCPGNNESAGKRRSGKTRKGNKTLKSTLIQCAKSAVKHKNSFYYAQYQRLCVKRGANRATVAVAHSMLISIYHMLKENKEYKDLGAEFYNKFNKEKKVNSYIKKIKELGYNVQIQGNAQVS